MEELNLEEKLGEIYVIRLEDGEQPRHI